MKRVRLLVVSAGLLGAVTGAVWVFPPLIQFMVAIREAERRFAADRGLVAPVLAANPAFNRIVPVDFQVLGFCLSGPVPTQADHDRLRAEMLRLFGEERVGHVVNDVWVERP